MKRSNSLYIPDRKIRKIKIGRKTESHVGHNIKVYFKEKLYVCVCGLDLYAS